MLRFRFPFRRSHPALRAARERAEAHLRLSHPGWRVTNARLRADEPNRYIFVLFYDDGGPPVVPGRYRVVAVCKDDGAVRELPLSPESPYWIRGYK